MKLNDAIFGFVLLALGAVILFVVQSFPKIPGQQVGPALFPGLIAAGLCGTGLLLVLRGLREPRQAWVAFEDWVNSPRHIGALLVLVGSVVFYIVAANWLGFLPTAFLILLAMFSVLRVRPGLALLLSVVATFAIHFAFYKLLRVPLPWGVLTPYAW